MQKNRIRSIALLVIVALIPQIAWSEDPNVSLGNNSLQEYRPEQQEFDPASLLSPASPLQLSGAVDTVMMFSTKDRPFPSGMPLFLFPESPFGLDSNTFDLHARQSNVRAVYSGPEIGNYKVGANVVAFFQNDSLSTDDYGLLVFNAYGELKNDQWRFAAGLQRDIFNPLAPNVIYLTQLYASGDAGSYRGQLRAERSIQRRESFDVKLQLGFSEPISTLVTSNQGRFTEDNGWPNVEGRIEFGFGPICTIRGTQSRSVQVGVSGVIGQFRNSITVLANPPSPSPRAVIDTKGLGVDFEWKPNHAWGVRGEFFTGQGLGEYNAGVLQSFNSDTFQEIQTTGGFAEIYRFFTDKFHVHLGYGIDDPSDSDLSNTQRRRNETLFTHFAWDVTPRLLFGIQVDYRKTTYTQFLPNAFLDGESFLIGTRVRWSF